MRRRPLANALDIDLRGGLTDAVTPHAGSALLIELGRRSGVIGAAEKHLPAKRSPKGLRPGELVESFVLLGALGGECLDDFDGLRRDRGLAALPGRDLADPWRVSVRSDSAAYDRTVLDHWQGRGWRFAVSADMSPQLRAEVMALPFEAWQPWAEDARGAVREWAEVPFVPSRAGEKRDTPPYRYLAIRVRAPQGMLFGDGHGVKHFAVVTNDWEADGRELLEWQRGKAGTIEHVNHILKNELAAGVYPSDKFGANAAWPRLQVLTHNLLELLKQTALDGEYRTARPKRLRFAIFTRFGRVVRHAGGRFVRLVTRALEALVRPGLRRLRARAWAAP